MATKTRTNTFANGRSVACKAAEGKSICAFPDVCLSPPSPPAGPLPVPYPNTGKASDTSGGSKTVTVGDKEVMLKDSSYFKLTRTSRPTPTRTCPGPTQSGYPDGGAGTGRSRWGSAISWGGRSRARACARRCAQGSSASESPRRRSSSCSIRGRRSSSAGRLGPSSSTRRVTRLQRVARDRRFLEKKGGSAHGR